VIVVDTSVLVDLFRGKETKGALALRRLESEGIPFCIPVVCCQELLSGARDTEEWDLLVDYLQTQHLVWPADPWLTHSAAARIMVDCRAQGITLRGSTDCLIAQLALENDGALLHSDRDFDRIAEIRPLRTWDY
jgi:predicted nucleic acid-binding protein